MRSIYNLISKKELRYLYENRHFSLRFIAVKYHCDPGVIARALRTNNIPVRHPTAALSFSENSLRTLYLRNKLSTYKIADQYNCDPKTVYKYLILNNITVREPKRITLTKRTLFDLYICKRKSLAEISKIYNYSPSGLLKKLAYYQIKRRSVSEANTQHTKFDFDGNQVEKAYLLGFRLGDLGVSRRSPHLVHISSGTTKIAQSRLIYSLFCTYGPVWIGKRDKRNAMNVSCSLNNSFSFLLPKHFNIPAWVQKESSFFFAFLAGYTDAEGNIAVSNGRARFRLRSYDLGILRGLHNGLKRRGMRSLFGLDKKAGVDKRGVRRNKDCWFLIVNDKNVLFQLLTVLQSLLRHQRRKKDATLALANVTKRLSIARTV